MDIDCTDDRTRVRVTDPTTQQAWEVWCHSGNASWASRSEGAGVDPESWVVQSPSGAKESIDMDGVLTRDILVAKLAVLLGSEETANKVLELFEPLLLDSAGVINPNVYVPCR